MSNAASNSLLFPFHSHLHVLVTYLQENSQVVTMEKFNLKWNDFQANVSKSFSKLRHEEELFDVTLVSDDEVHISSHKLVLSACSYFFKNIIRKSKHPNPLIYLTGVKSKELESVMNYIYNGEVELFQEDLDVFLNVAERLKIDGLTAGSGATKFDQNEDIVKDEHHEEKSFSTTTEELVAEDTIKNPIQRKFNKERTVSKISSSSNIENLKETIDGLVKRNADNFECRTCGKTTKKSSDIRRHVEMHIEGLSFECNICQNSYRSRASLKTHKQTHNSN